MTVLGMSGLNLPTFGQRRHPALPMGFGGGLASILGEKTSPAEKYRTRAKQGAAHRPNLQRLVDDLAEYREFLDFPDNWDDRGSLPFTQEAWKLAIEFILNNFLPIIKVESGTLELPEIEPGTKGEFFVNWETEKFRILVRLPSTADGMASYYAENVAGTSSVKDAIRPHVRDVGLITWIAKQLAS